MLSTLFLSIWIAPNKGHLILAPCIYFIENYTWWCGSGRRVWHEKKALLTKPFSIHWNLNVNYRASHFKYYLGDLIRLNLMQVLIFVNYDKACSKLWNVKYLDEIFIYILLSCLTVGMIMYSLDYQFNILKTTNGKHKKINFFIKNFVSTSVIYFHISFSSCFLPFF